MPHADMVAAEKEEHRKLRESPDTPRKGRLSNVEKAERAAREAAFQDEGTGL